MKHFGRTVALAKTELGKKNYQEALEKLRTVNCWTQKETRRYIDKAFAQHDEDSKHQWTVDIGFVEQFGVSVPPLDLTRGLVSTSHPPSEDRIENSIQSLAPITRRKKKGKKGGKKRYKRSDYKSPNR
ncbi:MAG TPA: hypothetical protein VJB59_06475 [Bdellovibrionota bacterium]|nr:hypothetical protein [Bdellovibrionota bacterium]